ncbi:membrane protein insertion efficiency factor YidD [Candidatus Parcubacteria bacterium]|nr:MAG: membrane protein insertion efficiency factor YidD [Candidatus Parcubacteria bacterium]
MFKYLNQKLKSFLISIIKIYQKTLSPDHGLFSYKYKYGFCRFRPTCSDYAILAIEKKGIIKGTFLAAWRIIRCNPCNKGGYDPLK